MHVDSFRVNAVVGVISLRRRLYGEPHRLYKISIDDARLVNRCFGPFGCTRIAGAGQIFCGDRCPADRKAISFAGIGIALDQPWPHGTAREEARIDGSLQEPSMLGKNYAGRIRPGGIRPQTGAIYVPAVLSASHQPGGSSRAWALRLR